MPYLRALLPLLMLASIAFSSQAYSSDYHKLTGQEKADFARFLGWVWGDGRSGYDGRGILYKGGKPEYTALVTRLSEIRIDGKRNPFGFPESGDRRVTHAFEYWYNSLPGGNPGDPQILRDAIRHPSFLAGILETEGQIFHSDPAADFYVADQTYAPSHPKKIHDIAYFGPERMIQLVQLLEEVYGFSNPAISVGRTKYQYNTHRSQAFDAIRRQYSTRKRLNESGNLQPSFTVKVYVKAPYFDEIRDYGYFAVKSGKYRTPAPDYKLRIIRSTLSDQNAEANGSMSFGSMSFSESNSCVGTRIRHTSGKYLNSDLSLAFLGNGADKVWELSALDNGHHQVISQTQGLSNRVLFGYADNALALAPTISTWNHSQWKVIRVANTSNRYLLRNRGTGTYLRVRNWDSAVEHGAPGTEAQWTFEEDAACN